MRAIRPQAACSGRGRRCAAGLLLSRPCNSMQFLRGALAGLGVKRSFAFFLAVHLLFPRSTMCFEFFQCRIKCLFSSTRVCFMQTISLNSWFSTSHPLASSSSGRSDAAAVLWDDIVVFSFHLFFSILFFSYAREAGFVSTSAVVQWLSPFSILRFLRSFA